MLMVSYGKNSKNSTEVLTDDRTMGVMLKLINKLQARDQLSSLKTLR